MQQCLPAPLQPHREPMRISVADQQDGLEEKNRGSPDGGRSPHEGKHNLGDHRLDKEEKECAREQTDREYGKHRDGKGRLPLVNSRCRADQVGISWQAGIQPSLPPGSVTWRRADPQSLRAIRRADGDSPSASPNQDRNGTRSARFPPVRIRAAFRRET